MDLPTFIQNNLTLLEAYIFSPDKPNFLNTQVTLPQDKKIFDFLLNSLSDREKDLIKEFGLAQSEKDILFNSKVYRELDRTQTQEERKKIINHIKELSQQLFFDFPKPVEVTQKNEPNPQLEQTQTITAQFQTEKTVQDVVRRALKEDSSNMAKLSAYGVKNLPLDILQNLSEEQARFIFQKQEVVRSLDPQAISSYLNKMIAKVSKQKNTTEDEEMPSDFFNMFSFHQIQALRNKNPKLFETYTYHLQVFRKQYQEAFLKFKDAASLTLDERQEKKELCKKALASLGNKEIYSNLIEKLTEEILIIDEAKVDSDLSLFIQYLKNIKSFNYENFETNYKASKKEEYGRNKYLNKSYPTLSFLESSRVNQSQLINKTIVSLFKANNSDTLQALSPYLNRKFLLKEQAKVKLSLGLQKEIPSIHQIFTHEQLSAIKERKQITFLPSNKKRFLKNDQVSLQIKIKNIKKITKKVYTIDIEKQLLQTRSNIDQNINLKFLVPEFQQEIITKETIDPFEQLKQLVTFEYLNNKLGQFIVQLQGQGITSRAIIRKGQIFLQNKLTLVGNELTFYDQQGKAIEELVIWRDNKRIEVKNKYLIPFGSQRQEEIIAVYQGHAQKLNAVIQSEGFGFTCDYLYHSESFIVGNKAKIIIHPTLKLNNQTATLSRLRNISITVSSVNNQNIASSQLIENVVFKNDQDYLLEYPIKAYIKSLSIAVNAEIELINKTIAKVNSSKNIAIDLEENYDNFVDLYLEKGHEGVYSLSVRGKNGESIPNAQINLSYEQFGLNFSFSKDLTTDDQGSVSLGHLSQVTKLTVKVTQNSFTSTRTWRLNNFGESLTYGGNIYSTNSYKIVLQQGEQFSLPLPCQLSINNDIIFQMEKIGIYYNKIEDVQITNNTLTIKNFTTGRYTLLLLRFNRRIDFEIIQGKPWIGGKIINEKNQAYTLNQQDLTFIALGDIKVESKEGHLEYSIDIISREQKLPSDLRVHIFAKNYLDSQNNQYLNCESKVICPRPNVENVNFRQSSYFHNKKLSDQTAYVLNRKSQEVTNGNNLEKPHIFLKRVEVRATEEKEEQLRDESSYDLMGDANYSRMVRAQKCMDMNMAAQMRSASYGGYGTAHLRGFAQGSASISLNRSLNSHNNFLYRVGHCNPNLKLISSIKVPKGYNQLVVYLFTQSISIKREYSLPQSKIQRLNLTHPAIKDADKKSGWTMSRQIYPLRTGQKRQISRNSTWTTVSLSNVVEYAKILSISLPEWITSWKNYPPEKKLQIYDKQICHELNFYIYRNDKAFFEEVVRPFLQNKLIKTFVDHYLLDDKEQILKAARTHVLDNLNSFQKAILVQKLKVYGYDKEADNLASALELPFKPIKKSTEQFKQFFETVLNAKKQASFAPKGAPPPPASDAFAFAFGAPPRAASHFCSAQFTINDYQEQHCRMAYQDQCYLELAQGNNQQMSVNAAKEQYKPGFKQTQKTKEYTETTYSGINNPSLSSSLISPSLFWAELARHYSSSHHKEDFLCDKFSDFTQKNEFVLACSIFSNEIQADYELANLANGYEITAKNSFLIFVREVKSLGFEQSKNVVLNQRFFDPKNRYIFDEQGNQVQKQVNSFLVQKPYAVQTLITNISGSNLQIQLLMDIPQGSIPLLSHEQTQIINVSLPAYNTKAFERQFYFPSEGNYSFYPANASKGRSIISKSAQIDLIKVTTKEETSKLQTLDNILRSGSDQEIFAFIKTKNIFDYNVFNFDLILWKLKDRQFFNKIIEVLKERQFYHATVWSFAIYHNDFDLVKEYIENTQKSLEGTTLGLPIFQYYPYYSRRAHKFADENKSTIRVKQFRQNYARFLFGGIFSSKTDQPYFVLTHIYYLILQDRILQAKKLYEKVDRQSRNNFKIQYDYIDCFFDMYDGATTDYKIARQISSEYKNYPVESWRKLFADVYETLYKQTSQDSEESTKGQQVTFSTTVVNSGAQIKINRPAQVRVIINFYEIDIELYFSEFPFSEITTFSAIQPTKSKIYQGADFKVEKLDRSFIEGLKNVFVQIYDQKLNSAVNKVTSFFWTNPEVKVKINEKQGTLRVYHKGKKCTTSYCKIYSKGSKGIKFARDGYTDVASTFRYALDVKDIQEFAILVLTDHGGSIHRVKPPSIY